MLARTLILRTAQWRPFQALVRRSVLFRPLVRRFVAGDTLDQAMAQSEALCRRGLLVSLDYLGENTRTEGEAIAACDMYIAMLRRISASPHAEMINISIKLTQCGLDISDEFAECEYRRALEVAKELNIFVRVDMESSQYTARTVDMIQRVFPDYPLTGTVLQSCLRRTPDDVEIMLRLGARVRLVKGAYLEPDTVAYASKDKVDEAFLEQGKRLMEAGNYPAFATHDLRLVQGLKAHACEIGIEKRRFEWQMLYGVRRDLQETLRSEGYPMRVYVPFGEHWYPYFVRRLAERPANALFLLKSLFKR